MLARKDPVKYLVLYGLQIDLIVSRQFDRDLFGRRMMTVFRQPDFAEASFAGLLAACALFMGFNEGGQNWQSMWTCAIYLLLAFTLSRARAVQIPK